MSQPTADLELHEEQLKVNNAQMEALLKTMFPDIVVPYEYIYQTLAFLEETQVNAAILPKIIRGVHNIVTGTGKGQVTVHVLNNVTTVDIKEQDYELNTKVIIEVDKEVLEQK